MTAELLDLHFRAEKKTGLYWTTVGRGDQWTARHRTTGGWLCADGNARRQIRDESWFEHYADVEAAYDLWMKREGNES